MIPLPASPRGAVAALAALASLTLAQAQQPPADVSLEPLGPSPLGFELRVVSDNTNRIAIEASTNLVDWSEIASVDPNAGTLVLHDPAAASLIARYYRARETTGGPVELGFKFGDYRVLAGDTIALRVSNGPAPPGGWLFLINGTPGGDATIGTIRPHPTDPNIVIYTAPDTAPPDDVSITAEIDGDPLSRRGAVIDIEDIVGELVITPPLASINVNQTVTFQAGIEIVGFGFLPFNRVYWKVNGTLGGNPTTGGIGNDGTYFSPQSFTPGTPLPIEVGFSLSPAQAPLRSAPVTVTQLTSSPSEINHAFCQPPVTPTITATLSHTDGTSQLLPAAALDFFTSDAIVADVDATGTVTFPGQPGQTTIQVTDVARNLFDTTAVTVRSAVGITNIEARAETDTDLSLDLGGSLAVVPQLFGIEVTEPGGAISLDPQLLPVRGFFNVLNPGPGVISGTGNQHLTFAGSGDILTITRANGVPQLTNTTAVVQQHGGIVLFGDTPGSGVVTANYDDGTCQNSYPITATYSRLDLDVTTSATTTNTPGEAFITEWLDVAVTLTNPNPTSNFIGRTPVHIAFADGSPFVAAYRRDLTLGTANPPKTNNADLVEDVLTETTGLTLEVAREENTLNLIGVTPNPQHGKLDLQISPRSTGPLTLVVTVLNDRGIAPAEIPVTIKNPSLAIAVPPDSPDFQNTPGYGARQGSAIVTNSYIDLLTTTGPAVFDFLFPDQPPGTGHRWTDEDPPVWRITKPDGTTRTVPVVLDRRLSTHFREPGTHSVTLGLKNRAEVTTAPLAVNVVEPSAVDGRPTAPQFDGRDVPVPTTNQLGAFKILSPTGGAWLPDRQIPIALQCYDALGNPRPIGREIRNTFQSSTPGVAEVVTSTYQVIGVRTARIAGPRHRVDPPGPEDPIQHPDSPLWADKDGVIRFGITIPESFANGNDGQDLRIILVPFVYDIPANIEPKPENLALEHHIFLDGEEQSSSLTAFAVADFTNPLDLSFTRQELMVPGRGLVISPRQIPVASQNLRDAAGTLLPENAAEVFFTIEGTDGFADALANGTPTVDLGPGLQVLDSIVTIDGNAVNVRASTDLTFFQNNPDQLANREVKLTFPDTAEWFGEIELFTASIEGYNGPQSLGIDARDPNLPLNASYGVLPTGAVGMRAALTPPGRAPLLTFQVTPSVHAAWDADRDGVADDDEDLDNNGIFDSLDISPTGGVPFRGRFAENPLVAFDRTVNQVGMLELRNFTRQLRPSSRPPVALVYGNIADDRRLDRKTGQLGDFDDPDSLPDFVSRDTGGEMVLLKAATNYADIRTFTAYNLTAEVEADLPDPVLEFDRLVNIDDNDIDEDNDLDIDPDNGIPPIEETYRKYSGFNPDAPIATLAATGELDHAITVWVDREAQPSDLDPANNFLIEDFYPIGYLAGLLDHYYLRRNATRGYGSSTRLLPTGRDGRLRPFDDLEAGNVTGVIRRSFGIDLDGVLYDPSLYSLPDVRPSDINVLPDLQAEIELLIATADAQIDRLPNSPEILDIPVVADFLELVHPLTDPDVLTDQQLVPRTGATSGGTFDLDRTSPGRARAVAKTPGADFPGLHAGHLVWGKPLDMVDPRSSTVEDDIRDVLVKRDLVNSPKSAPPVLQEDRFFGTPAPRRVMTFSEAEDQKAPVRAAVRSQFQFAVLTDPPVLTPGRDGTLRFKSLIDIRELPPPFGDDRHLIVTSQSDGNEKALKAAADAGVDLAVDLVANAVLGAATGGSYLTACGGSTAKSVRSAVIGLGLGLMESESLPDSLSVDPAHRNAINFSNRLLRSGVAIDEPFALLPPTIRNRLSGVTIPGVKIPSAKSLYAGTTVTPERDNVTRFFRRNGNRSGRNYKISNPFVIDHCALLNAPFGALKTEIKNTFSPELFGGGGTASAIGTKSLTITIPTSAQLEDGLYSLVFWVASDVIIEPKPLDTIDLSALPYLRIYSQYPSPDTVSDRQLHNDLIVALDDPNPNIASAAGEILDAIATTEIRREMGINDAGNSNRRIYRPYRLSSGSIPSIGAELAPGMLLDQNDPSTTDDDTFLGDFALTPGETRLPVAVGAAAIASRSNENATAQASVDIHGLELVFRHAVILPPPSSAP